MPSRIYVSMLPSPWRYWRRLSERHQMGANLCTNESYLLWNNRKTIQTRMYGTLPHGRSRKPLLPSLEVRHFGIHMPTRDILWVLDSSLPPCSLHTVHNLGNEVIKGVLQRNLVQVIFFQLSESTRPRPQALPYQYDPKITLGPVGKC